MERVYRKWETWECYKSGMYRYVKESEEIELTERCLKFMANTKKFSIAMKKVTKLWVNSMLHFLSNPSQNKRAFVGQCAAQYAINCPEKITRIVWKMLTEKERIKANKEADKYIEKWKKKLENTFQDGSKNATIEAYQMKLHLK